MVRQSWEGWLTLIMVCLVLGCVAAAALAMLTTPLALVAATGRVETAAPVVSEMVTVSACSAPGTGQTCTITFAHGQTRTIRWMRVTRGSAPLSEGTHVITRMPGLFHYGTLGASFFVWA